MSFQMIFHWELLFSLETFSKDFFKEIIKCICFLKDLENQLKEYASLTILHGNILLQAKQSLCPHLNKQLNTLFTLTEFLFPMDQELVQCIK